MYIYIYILLLLSLEVNLAAERFFPKIQNPRKIKIKIKRNEKRGLPTSTHLPNLWRNLSKKKKGNKMKKRELEFKFKSNIFQYVQSGWDVNK